MGVIKKCNRMFREMMQKAVFHIKLREMDWWFYILGMGSWKLFPPSFYYTHTEEEIQRITKETVRELRELLEEP